MKKIEQENSDERGMLFTRLYLETFPTVAAFVSKRGGSLEKAKDIFQDALILYYEQVYTTETEVRTIDKAYLLGIAKNLWYGQAKESKLMVDLSGLDAERLAEIEESEAAEIKLLSFLEVAGRRCMEMLKAFYYDSLSLSKISERFGFSGTRSATVQKYKCLEKVRDEVKERKLEYADFSE